MRILIAAVTAPSQMNGVSRHAENLAGALLHNRSISSVHFLAGCWQKSMFRQLCNGSDPRLHAHFIELGDANIRRLGWYYRELPEVARQLGADVVHFACPAPLRRGAFLCSTVVSLHDLYPFEIRENFGRFRSILTRSIMSGCIRNVDAIACVSRSTLTSLQTCFPEQSPKAVSISNVVESWPVPRPGISAVIPDGRFFLLCVAQHRRNKNIQVAIQTLSSLIRERIVPCDAQLAVVGIPGPETQNLLKLIRHLSLERNVLLLSGLSDPQLQWCYLHCKVLLAPSLIEGFGLPVAEAMACGCPVVCSDIPAFRQFGADVCHYVAAGSGELHRYTEAVRLALATPRPLPFSLAHLSPQRIGHEYAKLYERLADRGMSCFW